MIRNSHFGANDAIPGSGGNLAGSDGGAIDFQPIFSDITSGEDPDVLIEQTTFVENKSTAPAGSIVRGGAINFHGSRDALIVHIVASSFVRNEVNDGGSGGAFSIHSSYEDLTVLLDEILVDDNKAGEGDQTFGNPRVGGGIEIAGIDNFVLRDSLITNNQTSGHGGGIHLTTPNDTYENFEAATVIERTTFEGNSAALSGGGLYVEANSDDPATIRDSTISGNKTLGNGGGLKLNAQAGQVYSDDRIVVLNSTIAGNYAKNGGGISMSGDLVRMVHSTVTNNVAGPRRFADAGGPIFDPEYTAGGGIYFDNYQNDAQRATLDHTIVLGNRHLGDEDNEFELYAETIAIHSSRNPHGHWPEYPERFRIAHCTSTWSSDRSQLAPEHLCPLQHYRRHWVCRL